MGAWCSAGAYSCKGGKSHPAVRSAAAGQPSLHPDAAGRVPGSRSCKHLGWQYEQHPGLTRRHQGWTQQGRSTCRSLRCAPRMPWDPGLRRVQVQLLGVEAVPLEGEQQQASVLESVTALAGPAPVTLRTGDRHCCLFRVWHDEASKSLPLGHLRVTWRRPRWVAALPAIRLWRGRCVRALSQAPTGHPAAPQVGRCVAARWRCGRPGKG